MNQFAGLGGGGIWWCDLISLLGNVFMEFTEAITAGWRMFSTLQKPSGEAMLAGPAERRLVGVQIEGNLCTMLALTSAGRCGRRAIF